MGKRRILLADDEPYLTFMLATRLREHDADVAIAADGEEAFRLARDQRPDLVLTDYQMPIMSGLELAKRLMEHRETSDVPVILLTARGHRLPATELVSTNIRHLIAKPFSTKELISIVSELCGLDLPADARAKAA